MKEHSNIQRKNVKALYGYVRREDTNRWVRINKNKLSPNSERSRKVWKERQLNLSYLIFMFVPSCNFSVF